MRRLAALLLAAIPLAGCVALTPPAGGFGEAFDAPLRARIVPDRAGLAVDVSDDAHVALFEVVPGTGAGLVYPAGYAEGRRLRSGFNRLTLPPLQSHRWSYLPHHNGYGPRFYLLVASREPLRVAPYVDSPFALRRDVGTVRFASLNAYGTMDRLAERVLPPQPEGDWDTDVFVVWPEHPVTERNPLVGVRCPNGRVVTVPRSMAAVACDVMTQRAAPPVSKDTTTGGEGEDDGVRVPGRSRPEPAGEQGEGEERARPTEPGETGGRTRPEAGGRKRPGVPVRVAPAPSPGPATVEPAVRRPEGEPVIREPEEAPRVAAPRVDPAPAPVRVEPVVREPAARVPVAEPEPAPRVDPPVPSEAPRAEPRRVDPPRSGPASRRPAPRARESSPPTSPSSGRSESAPTSRSPRPEGRSERNRPS